MDNFFEKNLIKSGKDLDKVSFVKNNLGKIEIKFKMFHPNFKNSLYINLDNIRIKLR